MSSLLSKAAQQYDIARLAAALPPQYRARLQYEWRVWARPEQLEPPGNWHAWCLLAGRGAGKSRAGSEWVRCLVESGKYKRIAVKVIDPRGNEVMAIRYLKG